MNTSCKNNITCYVAMIKWNVDLSESFTLNIMILKCLLCTKMKQITANEMHYGIWYIGLHDILQFSYCDKNTMLKELLLPIIAMLVHVIVTMVLRWMLLLLFFYLYICIGSKVFCAWEETSCNGSWDHGQPTVCPKGERFRIEYFQS